MENGFTQTVDCKSKMGERAFTNILNPRSSSIPSICVLSVIYLHIYFKTYNGMTPRLLLGDYYFHISRLETK